MKYQELLDAFNGDPVIDGNQLAPFYESVGAQRVQTARWVHAGRLIKLRNNVFLLPARFAVRQVYPHAVAARLLSPSYLSAHTALQYHGLIPDAVFAFTSVTTKRANIFTNPLGKFVYQHIRQDLFWGYSAIVQNGQTAYMAVPEKAILDLFHLRGQRVTPEYLAELRLQNPRVVSRSKLTEYAEKFRLGFVRQAVQTLIENWKGLSP